MPILLIKINRNLFPAFGRDRVFGQLALPHPGPFGRRAVIGRMQLHGGVVAFEVDDDVTPSFVIVDADNEGEVLAVGGVKAEHAGGAAAAHGEETSAFSGGPGAAGVGC